MSVLSSARHAVALCQIPSAYTRAALGSDEAAMNNELGRGEHGFCGGSHLGNSGNLQRRSCCGANDTRVCVLQASLTCILFCCFFYVTAESIQTLDEPMCSVSLRISLRTRKQLSLRKTSLLCLLSCVSSIDRVQAKVKRVTRV